MSRSERGDMTGCPVSVSREEARATQDWRSRLSHVERSWADAEFAALEAEIGRLRELLRGDMSTEAVYYALVREVARQDEKHGPFGGETKLGKSRLALACLEDETAEALLAWRDERKAPTFEHTREEVLQVAAVAIRALRDAL